ncbi:MAG: hypothetical protein CMI90_00825 [Pelagibacteraceae bacterium]|nr:hypothetical protein [Pelagibacteraceae bacterium]|tara:strand:- start:4566 stop:5114 length:549 start_codon:yes stop_codon:yes gene_type:complete
MAFTPGPNNIILSNNSINHGFKNTIPLILAVFFGFLTVLSLALLGIGKIFLLYPSLTLIMKIISSIFLLFLSYKIFFSSSFSEDKKTKPLSFFQVYFFQIINPKVIFVTVSSASLFLQGKFNYEMEFFMIFSCFAFSTITSGITWALIGHLFKRFADEKNKIIIFNRFMAVALAICIIMIIL